MSATMVDEATDLAPVGSRWYGWGRHFEVVEVGLLDGSDRPAVRVHRDGDAKPLRIPTPVVAILKKAVRTAT